MNKNVNPLLALAVIIIFGGIFALKTYFYGMALEVPKLNYLKESSTGTVTIRLGTKIYDYSPEGNLNHIIDLEQFGITETPGDYDFFSNGDLLINRDDFLPSIEDKVKRLNREANTNSATAGEYKGLQRCNIKTKTCETFNRTIPAIQGAHYIHIDRKTDDVYLSDVSRHQIRKLDKKGKLLAELKSGLQFPNQVFLEGETLWIVDTNNHAMKAVKATTTDFGEKIETHKFVDVYPRIWPSAFSKVKDNWWVNISNNSMVNASVVIFDKNWGEKSSLSFPKGADPVASLVTDNGVIIIDANNYQLYHFDNIGMRKKDFAHDENGDGIKSVLMQNKVQDEKYRLLNDVMFWIGLGLFTLLFVFALFQSRKDAQKEKDDKEADDEQQGITKDDILSLAKLPMEGEWIEVKPFFKKIKYLMMFIGVSFLFSVGSIAWLFLDTEKSPFSLIILLVGFGVSSLLMLAPLLKLSSYRIGFFKNHVTVEVRNGKHISMIYKEVKLSKLSMFSAGGFVVGEWFIPTGTPMKNIFSHKKLRERLHPYVLPENKLSGLESFKLQWNSPEGILKYSFFAAALMMVVLFKTFELA